MRPRVSILAGLLTERVGLTKGLLLTA